MDLGHSHTQVQDDEISGPLFRKLVCIQGNLDVFLMYLANVLYEVRTHLKYQF